MGELGVITRTLQSELEGACMNVSNGFENATGPVVSSGLLESLVDGKVLEWMHGNDRSVPKIKWETI